MTRLTWEALERSAPAPLLQNTLLPSRPYPIRTGASTSTLTVHGDRTEAPSHAALYFKTLAMDKGWIDATALDALERDLAARPPGHDHDHDH